MKENNNGKFKSNMKDRRMKKIENNVDQIHEEVNKFNQEVNKVHDEVPNFQEHENV